MKKMKYLLLILCFFLLVGCTAKEEEKKEEKAKDQNETKEEVKGDYNLGESFDFMNFEVTINNADGIVKVNKELSSDNGIEVIKVPITVKNKGEEKDHISMFYYKMYGPDKKELSSKGQHFEDAIDYASDLNPNESYTKYIYIPYSSNGNYILEFNNFAKKIKIVVNIEK
jgi:hypothetical protein